MTEICGDGPWPPGKLAATGSASYCQLPAGHEDHVDGEVRWPWRRYDPLRELQDKVDRLQRDFELDSSVYRSLRAELEEVNRIASRATQDLHDEEQEHEALRTVVTAIADAMAAEAEPWDEPFRTGPLRWADALRTALGGSVSDQDAGHG